MKTKIGTALLLAILVLSGAEGAEGVAPTAVITTGSGSGLPGATGVVVTVDLASLEGAQVSGVNFDLSFDGSRLKVSNVTIGDAALSAEKSLGWSPKPVCTSKCKIIIFGLDNSYVINDGTIANVRFDVLPGASPGTVTLGLSEAAAAHPTDPSADANLESVVNGSFTVLQPPTPTPTLTPPPTPTPTATTPSGPTSTPTRTNTPGPATNTPTRTPTPLASATHTLTPTGSPTLTPGGPEVVISPTASPSATPTPDTKGGVNLSLEAAAQATGTAIAGFEAAVAATATALAEPAPTAQPTQSGPLGLPIWAWGAIALGLLGLVAAIVGGGVIMWRRRRALPVAQGADEISQRLN